MFTLSRVRELFLLVFVLFIHSCNDPYEEIKATATYSFRLATNTTPGSHFTFDKGYLTLERFSLLTRDNLHKLHELNHNVNEEINPFVLHSITGEQNVTKKVASGVFQSMFMELLLPETMSNVPFTINTDGSATWSELSSDLYPILVEGNYNNGEVTRKIVLAIDSLRVLTFEAQRETFTSNPDKTIILDQDNIITLEFSPQRWFSEVTPEMVITARTIRHNNDDVIFIHRTHNSELYRSIIKNLTLPAQLSVRTNPG